MKNLAFVLLLIILLIGCQSTEDLPPPPPDDIRFKTSSPSRLYFNNIRSTAYAVVEFQERFTKKYTLTRWPDTAATPFLVLNIIDYWLYDQAYIDLSWRGLAQDVDLPWKLLINSGTEQDSLILNNKHWGDQYEFAKDLNQALLGSNTQITLVGTGGEKYEIMANEETKRLFRLSWKDYERLTYKTNKNNK